MAQLTLTYSSIRSLQEYTEKFYIPAALLYQKRLANHAEEGRKIEEWKTFVSDHWNGIYYASPALETKDDQYHFSVPVFFNGINPADVSVELYANGINGSAPVKQKMNIVSTNNESAIFSGSVPADRPSYHYTPRIIPANGAISIPLECSNILWQH
jgi:starch phosphorylase